MIFSFPCGIIYKKLKNATTHAARLSRLHKSDHGNAADLCYCVFLFAERKDTIMPQNQFQRMMFALMTVIVTVHAYVFYSLYVVNGQTLMSVTGKNTVLGAIDSMGGVYMFGTNLPIWAVVIVEFIFAYTLEILVGSPCSFKLACAADSTIIN